MRLKLPRNSLKKPQPVPEVSESDRADSHVHFYDVSFIDESPSSADSLETRPIPSSTDNLDSEKTRPFRYKSKRDGKSNVKRSISFCNSSTSTTNLEDVASCSSGPNALLSNRAYKSPCSLQNIAAEVTVKDSRTYIDCVDEVVDHETLGPFELV